LSNQTVFFIADRPEKVRNDEYSIVFYKEKNIFIHSYDGNPLVKKPKNRKRF